MKSAASWIAVSAAVVLTACGGANARISADPVTSLAGPAGDYPMVLGDPFTIDGVTYTPVDVMNYDSVGYASAAAGMGVSGAHRTLPLPSYVEVTSLESGRTILVRLTQRGPMQGKDLVSLSAPAWAQLGPGADSRVAVRVRRVNPPEAERALLRSGAQAPARMDTPPGLLAVLKRKLAGPVTSLTSAMPPAAIDASVALAPQPAPTPTGKPTIQPAMIPKVSTPVAPAQPRPAPAQPKPEPIVAVPAAKGLYVQIGAYSTRQRAQAAATATGGSVATVRKLFRVRSGPHKDRGQADAALAKVRTAGYADAKLVTAP